MLVLAVTMAAADASGAVTVAPSLVSVWVALISTLGLLFAVARYIISSKITPLEKDVEKLHTRLETVIEPIRRDIDQLKTDLLVEVKKIADANLNFRITYERDMADIKLMLAKNYVTKDDCEKNTSRLKDVVVSELKK